MNADNWQDPERYLPSAHTAITLQEGHLVLDALSAFQRILLITDGTLTELLEAYLQEPIHVVKLAETLQASPQAIPALEIQQGQGIIQRDILLQGKHSGKNWLYAESIIVPDRLSPEFREQLLTSQVPIGKLWLAHRLETFKEKLSFCTEPAQQRAHHFALENDDILFSRTYRVFSQGKAIMLITEKFPQAFYR
ncbi:4-hydroxybenzoate synthetase (chorismate lyase) [Beggiatoa alba B18LD]|uniref:4-hydroxybenzoate synthetase (Chorismate lyase) n=1 Tax=Beggiatoa alba B18LD TaxID=395493 RepID=I3CDH7_9GAMM|nr:chorismate pyruvate-lyase family protein [Beggiatoa alba]EIJ41670.1 4-hydroxybenzoate synthetase (chorismate lyase) [Beggiatoa alba B18LD]